MRSKRRSSKRRSSKRSSIKRSSSKRISIKRISIKRRSIKRRTYMTSTQCKQALKEKIQINMREYNKKRYSSRQQALAVSYSQIGKKHPSCKKHWS